MRALVLIALLAGCSTADPVGEPQALAGSVGVLHVERTADGAAGRTVMRAAFARYQGIDGQDVLRLLGSRSLADVGSCTLGAGMDAVAGDDTDVDADVELLDVGALHIGVADAEERLTPRTFPDLASVIAGVFYAGDAALPMPRAELDEYRFHAEGSADVGPFDVLVPAPAEPSGLALVGADGTSAMLDGRLADVARTGSLTLLWDAEDPRDQVEVELLAAGQSLTCVARDEGSVRVASSLLAALPADPQARLSVRRVRVSPFDAPGMDAAYARVAATRSTSLSLR